jgi:thiamine-monophosphate kinase
MPRVLAEIGEFGVIARIERIAERVQGRAVELGIGDDAAVLRPPPGERLLVSTDALVENVHFRWSTQAPITVGRRALAANLSDLAAMGGRPLGFVLALAAPPSLPVATLDGVARGLIAEARRYGCPLVGGNVTRAQRTSLTLTVLGAARPGRILTRTGARVGDRILVTGSLGAVALEVARGGRVRRVPRPRIEAGRALARMRGIGGCIDVSDGLEADLGHLLAAGRKGPLGAELDPARIPVPGGFKAACKRAGLDPERLALQGGEDYELLFTLRPAAPGVRELPRRLGVAVTEIGRVTRRQRAGKASAASGWRHF